MLSHLVTLSTRGEINRGEKSLHNLVVLRRSFFFFPGLSWVERFFGSPGISFFNLNPFLENFRSPIIPQTQRHISESPLPPITKNKLDKARLIGMPRRPSASAGPSTATTPNASSTLVHRQTDSYNVFASASPSVHQHSLHTLAASATPQQKIVQVLVNRLKHKVIPSLFSWSSH